MSDLLRRIEHLEREVSHLTEERRFAMTTLEMAASLLIFDNGSAEIADQEQALTETAGKILSMLNFEAICFYLINEEDASFSPAFCEPADYQPEFEKVIDQLIEDQTFAWALGRNKGVRIEPDHADFPLLLHSLSTASRTRGMFIGIPVDGVDDFESPIPLLTMVLHSCANILESLEVYHRMRSINNDLQKNISELQQKSNELNIARESSEKAVKEKNHFINTLKSKLVQKVDGLNQETEELFKTGLTPVQIECGEKLRQRISQMLAEVDAVENHL